MDNQDMFFNKKVAEEFAKHEQNIKHKQTSKTLDDLAVENLKEKPFPYHVAELFAGAHTDRYHNLFSLLKKTSSKMDWVDHSPIMLDLAKKYLEECEDNRKNIIQFIQKTHKEYLNSLPDQSLDLILIKYSIDYIQDPKAFFELVHKKMKKDSVLIANLTTSSPTLKSHSTNAKYFYKGKPIPERETITLNEGDTFAVKFFKESGNPNSELIKNAQTTKHYFPQERLLQEAKSCGLESQIANYKNSTKKSDINSNILILKK